MIPDCFALVPVLGVVSDLWFAVPLVVAISLVYSATRHERMPAILDAAARFGGLVCLFMGIAFAIIYYLSVRL
jgi:hypothetical protein